MESWVSGFAIHLRVTLIDEEGDALLKALRVDEMVRFQGGSRVSDRSAIGSNGWSESLGRLLRS